MSSLLGRAEFFTSAREVIEQVLLGLTKLTPAEAGVLMRRVDRRPR
jgi:hypothetical protein